MIDSFMDVVILNLIKRDV